jgi:hypothetical protein
MPCAISELPIRINCLRWRAGLHTLKVAETRLAECSPPRLEDRKSTVSQSSCDPGLASSGSYLCLLKSLTVSNGLRRTESRGFDFDVEERSIAVQRLNSRLSQFSATRRSQTGQADRTMDSPTKSRIRSGSIGGGFSNLRTRAGSILKPKKGFHDQTRAMEGERGPDEAR